MKTYQIGVAVALLALTACGGGEQTTDKKKQLETYKQQYAELKTKIDALETELKAANPNAAIPAALKAVEVLTATPKDFAHYVEVQGNVESDQNVSVAPETMGVIVRLNVERGQTVRRGQVIAEIDAAPIRNNIAEVETRLDLARTVFQKQESLWKQQIGTELQYLQAKNNVESLERTINTLKSQLAKAFVKAPIDGVVDDLFQKQGEMGNPALPMARIVNLAKMNIKADVSEIYLTSIRKGEQVNVSFPALNTEMPLRITALGQYVNPANRTFKVEMAVGNQGGMLKPNLLAVVKIKDFSKKNAVVIPTFLIQKAVSGEQFVFVVKQQNNKNVVEKVAIKTGKSYNGETLVEDGLKGNETLISKGYNEVVAGEEVSVVPTEKQTS